MESSILFFLVPVEKLSSHREVITNLEQDLTARFSGLSRVDGLEVFGLWQSPKGECVTDRNAIFVVTAKDARDVSDLAAMLRHAAKALGEEALIMASTDRALIAFAHQAEILPAQLQ